MTEDLRRTALTDRHEQLGARLGPFAGWLMPIEFEGTLAEHEAVRTSVGVFDVSHLGTVFVRGTEAGEVVAASFTNDPGRLDDGQSQYTLCPTPDGGIADDLIVYRLAADRWMAVPNAANTPRVVDVLAGAAGDRDALVDDRSTEYAILAVQGPRSLTTVTGAIGVDPSQVAYLGVAGFDVDGDDAWVCRTGYTGEVGCELVVPNRVAPKVFAALLDAGAAPIGLGARDTLRLEMGYPLHGNDLGPDTSPYEARLGWAVKLDHADFPGRDALRRAKEAGPTRRLYGLRSDGRRIPRQGMEVFHDGAAVGTVTSGSFSPTLGVGIGLAYVADPLGPGDEVVVDLRGRDVPFEVVRPPFVDRDPKP